MVLLDKDYDSYGIISNECSTTELDCSNFCGKLFVVL